MVATRRGGRLNSPPKGAQRKQSDTQATPSTARRTRNAQQDLRAAQQNLAETCSHVEKTEGGRLDTPAASSKRRCTRASRLHSPEQPSTPVGSLHEGDISDVESLCSAVSDAVESSSSAVSTAKPGLSRRQSMLKKLAQTADSAKDQRGDGNEETAPETEPESRRVTRSQRKSAHTRSSARRPAEDSEASEAESAASSVSGRRLRRQVCPIPMHLEELSESSRSTTRTTRRTKATREKAASTGNNDKTPCCDSEGFESGPTYSLSSCGRRRTRSAVSTSAADSESEVEVSSSAGSRGTPCSSRTASGTSARRAPASRRSTRASGAVPEKSEEPAEEESLLEDSKLESTVTGEDVDCTLVEEVNIQTSGEEERLDKAELTSCGANEEKVEEEEMDPSEDISEPAVIIEDLKEELSSENKADEASEMEEMQETIPASEPLQSPQSDPVTLDDMESEVTERQEDADVQHTQTDEDSPEIQPSVEEKLEVQVMTGHKVTVTAESDSEQHPEDVQVQKTKRISLLDSSEDEDDEGLMSDEDDSGSIEERRGEPSSKSEAASSSAVEGLFMIDTRPGQDADQQYYREEEEEAEEEEEFLDEEGEEDDEDSRVLFSSRNAQLKELSSRIDPGLRVKELGGLYISFDGSKSKPVSSSLQKLREKTSQDEVMKKSVIGPDFMKKEAVPPYSESKQALKLKRRAEREKSTGDGWFNMKAPEMTQDLKGDLQVLKMRGSLDPKRFYKKNDRDGFPKYFQVGRVVDSPVDFYHSRIPQKERKRTMVEELLNDAEFRQKNKKKYQQIIAEKAAQSAGKRRKKKFHHKK